MKRVSGLRRAARGGAAGLASIVMAVTAVPAFAGSEGRTSGWAGTYAGAFAGARRPDNRIVDVDGFSDWGNPGSRTGYAGAGAVGVFVSGGPALARIVNSVTDTDYSGSTCLETDLRPDADDSFRRVSTEVGWAIVAPFEMPLAARWALRVDGSYLNFGSETYRVNLSGNNSCGPGGAMTPCRYTVRNRLGVVRLGIVYRFGE